MSKKLIYMFLFIGLLFFAFGISYYSTLNKMEKKQVDTKKHNVKSMMGKDKTVSNTYGEEVVQENANIVFKTEYKKSGEIKTEKSEKIKNLTGKRKEEVELIYVDSGYKVSSMRPTEVILVKKVDKYSPDKYVLGIKNGFIAICKTDTEGNIYIEKEEDITDFSTERLKAGDIEMLTNGTKDFQFNTRQEALDHLEDYNK